LAGRQSDLEKYEEASEGWSWGTLRLLKGIDYKRSTSDDVEPFPDLVVKSVAQIVSAGEMAYNLDQRGQHLSPARFHEMLLNPSDNMIVLDVRRHLTQRI